MEAEETMGGFLEEAALSQVLSDYMTPFIPRPKVIYLILIIHGYVLESHHKL